MPLLPQRRFPKLGSSTLSNPSPSDLVVRVKVATPAGFSREGADVLTSVNITIEVRHVSKPGAVRSSPHCPADTCWRVRVVGRRAGSGSRVYTECNQLRRQVAHARQARRHIHRCVRVLAAVKHRPRADTSCVLSHSSGDEVVFSGEGMPLELDLEETMDFLQREANYSECVEFWTIAAELNATVDGNQALDGDSGKEPASAAGADASRDDAKAASAGPGIPAASGEGSSTSADGSEAEEGDLKPDHEAEPKAGDEGSFAQRLLQRCGEQPTLDKGDLRVAIIVSAAARPNVDSPDATADTDPATSTAKAQHFFDNFVNK